MNSCDYQTLWVEKCQIKPVISLRKKQLIAAVNYKTKIGDDVIILSDEVGGQNNRNSRKHDAV